MKILLVGEYSNLHNGLADGLKALGHTVITASDGDWWKNYPRDIDLSRYNNRFGGLLFIGKLLCLLPKLRGFDVVQLINPIFLPTGPSRCLPIYKYLKKNNKKVFLGAFGMDYYWINECITRKHLRYSDFNFGDKIRDDEVIRREIKRWGGAKEADLNRYIADDCDGIIACLYEYYTCYEPLFSDKTAFIPLPIKLFDEVIVTPLSGKIKIFIGIDKERSGYKGQDIMLQAAKDVENRYSDRVEVLVAESIPFAEYKNMIDNADILLDQLYSYTPAMNALLAMSKGIVVIGGGEPENYEIINEKELRPIINVLPSYESVYNELEKIILDKSRLYELKKQSVEYIRRHHNCVNVAQKYLEFWSD